MFRNHRRNVLALVALLAVVTVSAVGVGAAEPATDDSTFKVEITDSNASVAENETLVVDATVTNTGTDADNQQIHLKGFDGDIVDSIAGPPVSLAPGEEKNVTLGWRTELGDAGDGEFSVQSDDETAVRDLSIEKGTFLNVTINGTNAPVAAGERLNVSVDVSTPRETLETARVRIDLDGSIEDERRSVLWYGETDHVEFSLETDESHTGERTLTVATEGDSEERTITIEAPDSPSDTDESVGSGDGDTGSNVSGSESDGDTDDSGPGDEAAAASSDGDNPGDDGSDPPPQGSDEQGALGAAPVVLLLGAVSIGSLAAYRLRFN